MSEIIDRQGLLDNLSPSRSLIIELGCGPRKRNAEAIGIDILDYPEVDLVGDIFDVLQKFPDSCVVSVSAHHFIEHIHDLELLMSELKRVVKPGGVVDFVVPHFSNPYFYSDPTHQRPFGLYTFCYMSSSTLFSRQVPTYQNDLAFRLEGVDLEFKSARPFYCRYVFKSVVGKIFNSCNYMKELYEENFCYLFPCYEIRYQLRRIHESLP